MSGENPRFPASGGHAELLAELHQLQLPFEEVNGHYGSPERSVIVHGIPKQKLYELGKKYGQESVIHGQAGQHEYIYTNGADDGLSHPGLSTYETWSKEQPDQPDDNYTKLPDGSSFRLHFDFDKKQQSGLGKRSPSWPGQYEWHDGHTTHHALGLKKDEGKLPHPHTAMQPKPVNDQAAGKGVASYAEFAKPFGAIDDKAKASGGSDLFHYDYHGKNQAVNQLVAQHGFQTYYAGGSHGKPDLANKNYNTGHLMVYSPEPGSGGDFGNQEYTDSWRKVHELAHALTYPDLNSVYGEGRRIGKLAVHRTQHEAERAVHWEWLAAHKQRELNKHLGIHVPDEVFHKELNTVMHDAAHRAVTGKFTEPSEEGFVPHSHKVPLETSMNLVRQHAAKLGVKDRHSLTPKPAAPVAQPAPTLTRHEVGHALYQVLVKAAQNIEPNLLPRGNSVANEKELTVSEFMSGLYAGLKAKEAELLALTKAEAAQNEAVLVKGEQNYDCVKCGEKVRGLMRKSHSLDDHKGKAVFKLHKAADCGPMDKQLGDGGISDASGEKGYAGKSPFKKYDMPAGSAPTSPGPKPGKTPDQKGKPSIAAPGSGGQIKKAAMPGSAPKPPGGAPKAPGATASPISAKLPKPPVMGAGTPAPNVKSEMTKAMQWKGPFGGAPKAAPATPISAQASVPQMMAKPLPTMPGTIMGTPGVKIPGVGAPKPAPAAPVPTGAAKAASKMPPPVPGLTPAQAAAPPLFSKPTAAPPPSTTPGLFPRKQ